ncbi:MAG TPA: adenylate/guanylate cyclase domain-containing protein [Stellaceae bacterium]
MATLKLIPDNLEFEMPVDRTVLAAVQEAGVPIASACGGNGQCSTCRVWVVSGLENCSPRSEIEAALAAKLRLPDHLRLACQTRATGDVTLRRLVLDDADLHVASLLGDGAQTRVGEQKNIAVLFSDISNFTGISENLSPYDVLFLLNKYYSSMGSIVEANRGYIDNFIGDGLMALFGIENEPEFALTCVKAALEMLAAVDRIRPQFKTTYDIDFNIRIGIHYGEAVIGSLGHGDRRRLTAIGDVVNIASRIETANKEAGTRLLISEPLRDLVRDSIVTDDFVRLRPRGATDRMTLYTVAALTPAAEERLAAQAALDTPIEIEGPVVAGKKPVMIEVVAGETYYWCACGRSKNQPFCDGSHTATQLTHLPYTAQKSGRDLLCLCKHTRNPPFCDGSHFRI